MKHVAHFKIVKSTGHGALGEMYEALDERRNRPVNLRTMELGSSVDAEVRQRFEREAQALARLTHPNIVAVLEHGETDDVAWIATEPLKGKTLREIVDAGVPLSAGQIVDIVAQLADGLDQAHRNGVVHRDIKPDNLVILDGPRVKITDFSVAPHANDQLTRVGSVIGTPKYMSPEQARGLPIDERSDIYAIGVILYELLTGKVPFEGKNFVQIATRVVNEKPLAPNLIRPATPLPLALIAGRCLAKRPADRYPTAGQVAADLRRYTDLPIPAGALAAFYGDGKAAVEQPVIANRLALNPTAGAETVPRVRDLLGEARQARKSRRTTVWVAIAAVAVVAASAATYLLR
ncbi:hypothetical protein BH10PSE17_BH10PSE17_24910 [soil metagenome]